MANYAFATLVTSDSYLPGALAVVAALKDVHSSPPVPPEVPFQTVCIVSPETVDVNTIKQLRRAFDVVVGVEVIEEQTAAGLQLLGRPDLHSVLTKLHVFRLSQYDKIIFLDADILPIRPSSHLFTLPHEFAAVPDVGWPDIFNSGMMVLTPGEEKFTELMNLVRSHGTWDGGDQGLLNEWQGENWHRLSFKYNTTPTAAYTYAPAYERFGSQINAIHFIGPNKPWADLPFRAPRSTLTKSPSASVDTKAQSTYAYSALVDRWFDVYDRHYRLGVPKQKDEIVEQRYESAWNEPQAPPPSAPPAPHGPPAAGAPLGLDELRRLAVEGSGPASTSEGIGEYRSLPLEGRIDLMRPKLSVSEGPVAEHPTSETHAEAPPRHEDHGQQVHPQATEPHHLQSSQPVQESTQAPPSPRLVPLSLHSQPPSPGHLDNLALHEGDSHDDHDYHEHHEPPPPPAPQEPPSDGAAPSGQAEQNVQPAEHAYHPPPPPAPPAEPPRPSSPPLITWNPAIEPPPNVAPPPSAFPSAAYFPNVWDLSPDEGKLHAGLTGRTDSAAFFKAPPPGEIPQQLIQEGHYANVIGSHGRHQTHAAPHSYEFSAQGHEAPPPQPSPERPHITPVFPWEEKPRHVPRRVFPEDEKPREDIKYIEDLPPEPPKPEPEPPKSEQKPRMHVQIPFPSAPSPPDFSRAYGNVWDSVPSIQRYAAKLVKPTAAHVLQQTPMSPRFIRRRSDSYRSRGEQSDANSMDGDVEDEVDDDEEARGGAAGRFSSSEREDTDARGVKTEAEGGKPDTKGDKLATNEEKTETKGERTETKVEKTETKGDKERPPVSGAKSPPITKKSAKKEYRSYGVQTIPKDVRSVGVQVSISSPTQTGKGDEVTGTGTAIGQKRGSPRHSPKVRSRQGSTATTTSASVSTPSVAHVDLPKPQTAQEIKLASEQMAAASPNVVSPQAFIRPPRQGLTMTSLLPPQHLPSGAISPRLHDQYAFDSPARTPAAQTPIMSPATIGNIVQSARQQAQAMATAMGTSGGLRTASPTRQLGMQLPVQPMQLPPAVARTSSTETADSPGPVSPADTFASLPGIGARKPPSRSWNPATGLDVFKRGSEEVLARFLRMGSWEDESPTHTHTHSQPLT